MVKDIFINGVVAGVLSTIACVVYSQGYFSILVDFSEVVTVVKMLSYSFIAAMSASLLYMLISKVLKNKKIADFIFNLIFASVSLLAVFFVLNSLDPEFENEDAAIFIDYYKGFIMPMLFFPVLGWMIAKPLFIKS